MKYDHRCFKNNLQRAASDSLRIGFSNDFTVAYLDILFDDGPESELAPKDFPIGQPRLPAAFRVGGMGIYSSPWCLSSDDVLLQGIYGAESVEAFISKE